MYNRTVGVTRIKGPSQSILIRPKRTCCYADKVPPLFKPLTFQNAALENAFFDWTVATTWSRSVATTVTISFLVGATCAYILATASSARLTEISAPLAATFVISVVNSLVHIAAVFFTHWRMTARAIGYLYYHVLLGLFLWILCVIYRMALAFVSATSIIWGAAALGYRFSLFPMTVLIWASSLTFIGVGMVKPINPECSSFPFLSIIFCVVQALLFSVVCVEQERIFRKEFLRSVRLERALEDRTEENRSLQAEIDKIRTSKKCLTKVDLDTPLDKILSKLRSIADQTSNQQTATDLDFIIRTLSSTVNILQPSMSYADSGGADDAMAPAIDQSVSQWLVNEVNVKAPSVQSASPAQAAASVRSLPLLPSPLAPRPPPPPPPALPASVHSDYGGSIRGVETVKMELDLAIRRETTTTTTTTTTIINPVMELGAPLSIPLRKRTGSISVQIQPPASQRAEEERGKTLKAALSGVTSWENFDIRSFDDITQGKPLRHIAMALFQEFGLIETFSLDVERLSNFFAEAEEGYSDVPYHNRVHAADVTQAVGSLLKHSGARNHLSDLDVLGCLLAASVHDLGHQGFNNSYEIQTASDRALMYNDKSVLENYHLSRAFFLLRNPDCNFICNMRSADKKELRKIVIGCVMATDLGQHFDHISLFKNMILNFRGEGVTTNEGRQVLINMLMKMADISNAGRPFDIYIHWVDRIMNEFYRQGDMERDHALPISPFMDRSDPQIRKCQCGFLDYLVLPTYTAWTQAFPDSAIVLTLAKANRQHWAAIEASENPSPPPSIQLPPTPVPPPVNVSWKGWNARAPPPQQQAGLLSQQTPRRASSIAAWISVRGERSSAKKERRARETEMKQKHNLTPLARAYSMQTVLAPVTPPAVQDMTSRVGASSSKTKRGELVGPDLDDISMIGDDV